MCRRCRNNEHSYLDTVIYKDNDTVVDRLCPNCMAEAVYDHEFPRAVGIYTSEISGRHGALKIVDAADSDAPETFYLLPDEAERLFRHELTPEDFAVLSIKHSDSFLLHDDFYDEDGNALQPMDMM